MKLPIENIRVETRAHENKGSRVLVSRLDDVTGEREDREYCEPSALRLIEDIINRSLRQGGPEGILVECIITRYGMMIDIWPEID